MAGQTPRLVTARDVFEAAQILILMVVSWVVPERHWPAVARMIARLIVRLFPKRARARRQRLGRLFDGRIDPAALDKLEIVLIAHRYVTRMQGYREYRPGGWRPEIRVVGTEHIDAALAAGHGVVLWITPFPYSTLATKKGLHESGYQFSHLSMLRHGFSSSRFGIRFLNPIWTRIEDRYLAERVRLDTSAGPAAAITVLRRRLQQNRIVSISVTRFAPKTVKVAFLNSELRLPTGPVRLARATQAALLPVFTVLTDTGVLEVNVDRPLNGPAAGQGDEPAEAVIQRYGRRLERYILKYQSQAMPELVL